MWKDFPLTLPFAAVLTSFRGRNCNVQEISGNSPRIGRAARCRRAAGRRAGRRGAATVYTAGDDDTFWKLSGKFGVPLDKLMAANADIDPLNIYKGLKLIIPDAGNKSAASGAKATAVIRNDRGCQVRRSRFRFPAVSTFAAGKAGETPKTYRKAIQVKATAYTASAEENGKWGAVDYFGNPLSLGTVAVDPDVIPLGSKLYITGYDYDGLPQGGMYAVARDTGGAIKGTESTSSCRTAARRR